MKNNRLIKGITAGLLTASIVLMTGCSAMFVSEDAKGYPLVNMLTDQEIIDYYVKALDHDAVVSKNIEVHKTNYEMRDVDSITSQKLSTAVSQIEGILSQTDYTAKGDMKRLISEDTFNYVKYILDSYKLSNSSVVDIKGALGYYFVDVSYDVGPQVAGKFKDNVDMLGLDGVWTTKLDGTYEADEAYLKTAVSRLNTYFLDELLDFEASYDLAEGLLTIKTLPEGTIKIKRAERDNRLNGGDTTEPGTEGDETVTTGTTETVTTGTTETGTTETVSDEQKPVIDTTPTEGLEGLGVFGGNEDTGADTSEGTGTGADTSEGETTNPAGEGESEPEAPSEKGDVIVSNSVTPDSRKVHLDIDLINKVVGASTNRSSFLPELGLVYNKPNTGFGGYGIYPEGSNGLKIFGYNRENLKGKIVLRYVFKDSVDGTADIEGTNIYCIENEISTGFSVSDKNVILPEFLTSKLEQLIERADRCHINCDLPGLMGGNIYEDKGAALLRGYVDIHTNTLKYMSKIRQVLARDIANNAYLLEVETTVTEGPASTDSYGTYTDKSYVVVQQLASKFIITDWVKVSRKLAVEPEIDPDTATLKRLVALNLSGDVSDETRVEIKNLLGALYTAGTNRLLRGPKEITNGGQTIKLEKGMYDCFDNDPSMLSTEKLEYMNSQLRNTLIKYGANTSSLYTGTVTEWIGGYVNQAEFTTEELVTYTGTGEGQYMQVYYLVSKMNDNWVIDERKIIDEYKVSGTDLENIKARVGQ